MTSAIALMLVALGALLGTVVILSAQATVRAIILRRIMHGTPTERRAARRTRTDR